MLRLSSFLAFAIVCCTGSLVANPPYRLPQSISPQHYKLHVITYLGDDVGNTFTGNVRIKVIANEETDNITLHSKGLKIDTESITVKELPLINEPAIKTEEVDNNALTDTKSMGVTKTDVDIEHDFFSMKTKIPLEKGKSYEIFIKFSADLSTGLVGYYRSSYYDQKSQKKTWLAVTQFEAIHARQAFPCFDEPQMKAKFEITLGHDKKYTALSNMPIKLTEQMKDKPDFVWDNFEESVPMSTYLVAYSVHDFEFREAVAKMKSDVLFKIWARRDAISQVDYAKEVGPKVLKFYEDYFDIKFPLPKMDMIAIPDFSAGAMENWGLVTYRETALLFQPNVSSASSQHRVGSVIAHELAHQWFGNLVTMQWWSDLWLNEGFATYVASLGVRYLHPEWNSFNEESVDNMLDIFKLDSLKSSHPVSSTIGDPSEISQIFDKISYEKGSSIIRMMHLFLGEESFRWGVSNYLKKHEYQNAQQDSLWESLTVEAHKHESLPKNMTVKQIMDTWTLQTGYPVISVNRNYQNNSAIITQRRYLADTSRSAKDVDNCWWVPLSFTTAKELDFNTTEPKDWLRCSESGESIPNELEYLPEEDKWVLFNIALSGLYKVKYDTQNWDLLIDHLSGPNYKEIGIINRAQLIDDALELAWSGDQDYEIALRIIKYLEQEREYIPWKSALTNLANVNRMLKRTAQYGLFKNYMRNVLTPIYEALDGINPPKTVNSDNLDIVKHKVLIAAWACRFQVGDCIDKSIKYFADWMELEKPDANNPIPLDMRPVIYCNAIRNGNEKEWQFLWQRYTHSNVGTEKAMILSSLGCSRETWLLVRYLDWTLNTTSGIRKQDVSTVFASVAKGDVGFNLAKTFLIEKIDAIHEYLLPETSRLARWIKPMADNMITEQELNELRDFVDHKSKLFEKSSQSVRQAVETVEINIQWQSNNYLKIGKYLSDYSV